MADYEIRRVENDDARLRAEARLLTEVFPATDRYTFDYLKWQYFANPDGDIVGFDAYADGEIAAHYVVEPLRATLFGKPARGVLSLNTATHPNHQGRGLFVKLATATYDLARELGYEFVVGVANANSTPGFIRKLGFQLVSPLKAEVGVGHVEASMSPDVQFAWQWSGDAKRWRLQCPAGKYGCEGERLYSKTHNSLVRMQLTTQNWCEMPNVGPMRAPLTAWIGLSPSYSWRGFALPVPRRMRPSPLNFIFLDLTGAQRRLDPSKTLMEAVNFDAY